MNTYLEVLLLLIVCVYFTAAKSSTECICTLKMFSAFQCLEISSTSGVNIHDISSLSLSPSIRCRGEIMDDVSM